MLTTSLDNEVLDNIYFFQQLFVLNMLLISLIFKFKFQVES